MATQTKFAHKAAALGKKPPQSSQEMPGLGSSLIAYCVEGESMLPTIRPGDIVLCTVANDSDILENEIYTVCTEMGVWVKRIQKCLDRFGNCTHLKLISDNHTLFEPFTVAVQEIVKILKVSKKLTAFEL